MESMKIFSFHQSLRWNETIFTKIFCIFNVYQVSYKNESNPNPWDLWCDV